MTDDKSNPSCALDQGLLLIARHNGFGPTMFTISYLEWADGQDASPTALKDE